MILPRFMLLFLFFPTFLVACQSEAIQHHDQPSAKESEQKKQPEAEEKPKPRSFAADVKGIITKLEREGNNLKLTVEEKPGQNMQGQKGHVTVTPKTNIRYAHLQTFTRVTMDELKLKQKVSVKCNGVHTMIYPLQCEVGEIVIE